MCGKIWQEALVADFVAASAIPARFFKVRGQNCLILQDGAESASRFSSRWEFLEKTLSVCRCRQEGSQEGCKIDIFSKSYLCTCVARIEGFLWFSSSPKLVRMLFALPTFCRTSKHKLNPSWTPSWTPSFAAHHTTETLPVGGLVNLRSPTQKPLTHNLQDKKTLLFRSKPLH